SPRARAVRRRPVLTRASHRLADAGRTRRMPEPPSIHPARRADLLIRPLGDRGLYVVKNPISGAYYQLGEEEHFLLTGHHGQRSPEQVRSAFQERFGAPLGAEEFEDFLALAGQQGLLRPQGDGPAPAPSAALRGAGHLPSILYWRVSLFDPDRLLDW